MKNIDKEKVEYNFNNRKRIKLTKTKQRNRELLLLTVVLILCESLLWYFVRNISVDFWATAGMLVLYVVLFVDIVDYNRCLRNVNYKVKEFLERENE